MSNRFPAKPATQPHQTYAISLPLQAALTSLNVSLEEELTRYRRYRQGYSPPLKSYALTATAQGNGGKTLELLSSPPPERPQPTRPPLPETLETAPEPPASLSPSADADLGAALSTSFANQNLAEPDTGFEPDSPPEDYLESSEELLRSLAEEEEDDDEIPVPTPAFNPWLTPLGIGSTLLLILLCMTFGVIFLNPSLMRYLFPNSPFRQPNPTVPESAPEPTPTPDNASQVSPSPNRRTSEFGQLTLETLSALEPKQLPEPSPVASPVVAKTPVESPKPSESDRPSGLNLRVLSLPVLSPPPEPEPLPPPTPQVTTVQAVEPPPPPAPLPPPPPPVVPVVAAPLSPEELPQLQAATPIMTPEAPSFAEPVPAPVPEPVPPHNYLQGFAGSVPIPVDMPPEQEWMPEPVATLPDSEKGQSYSVVANYEDGSTMAKIQALVPDAYLRNFADGIYVYLGSFYHREMAETFVEELKIEGISAKVYDRE